MLDKLERKLGRFAIPGLMNYLIVGYIIGYGCTLLLPGILSYMTLEPYMIIYNFQFWRVISWVLIPPSRLGIFTIIMLIFYWQLGRSLEQMWGTFKFNVYILGGIFITVVGAIVTFLILTSVGDFAGSWESYGMGFASDPISKVLYPSMGSYFSTYYINMSIFLAFALSIPDMQIFLYLIIPIRMKWIAILYAVLVISDFYNGNPITKVAILCSLLNFLIFFFGTRRFRSINPKEFKRRADFRRSYNSGQRNYQNSRGYGGQNTHRESTTQWQRQKQNQANRASNSISRHRCAVCGRTEITNPELEFRFCSKCNGNYEYCNEHLFNHNHVE